MNQELNENGARDFTYKIFYQESKSGNAKAEPFQIQVNPTSNYFHFKEKIIKEDSDLKDFDPRNITLYSNERAFRENKVFTQLGEPVGFEIGSDWRDPLIVLISARDAKKLRSQMVEDLLPKPDSDRFVEILGAKGKIGSGSLYFVNREDAMKNLLKIHLRHYVRRTTESGETRTDGPTIEYPLMDSLYGMGKSTFSRNYLAMIARFVSGIKLEIGYDTQHPDVRDQNLARRIGNELYVEGEVRVPDDMIIKCLNELHGARTLVVEFSEGSLAHSKRKIVERTFINFVTEASRKRFGMHIGSFRAFSDMLNALPKPVFIVLEEIGNACDCGDETTSRERFLSFAGKYGSFISKLPGTYYIFCGKAHFFWNVGVRAEDSTNKTNKVARSPGDIKRINLNPIREAKIQEMLENTLDGTGRTLAHWLVELYRVPIERITRKLYALTGGHPRNMVQALARANPLADLPPEWTDLIMEDVREAVKRWPRAIKAELFAKRHESLNLEESVRLDIRTTDVYFLATRIHAGFGVNTRNTPIFIMPEVLEYLEVCFVPFIDLVREIGKWMNDRRENHIVAYSKAHDFEHVIDRWFHSVWPKVDELSGEEIRPCGVNMGDFCPPSSVLYNLPLQLDSRKFRHGSLVRRTGQSSPAEVGNDSMGLPSANLGNTLPAPSGLSESLAHASASDSVVDPVSITADGSDESSQDSREFDRSEVLEPESDQFHEPLSITSTDLGLILAEYYKAKSFDVYFPRPRSSSPDILMVPHLENRCIIIGVQVKCLRQDSGIATKKISSEIAKFNPVVESAKRGLPGIDTRGVLFICATGKYTDEHFGPNQMSKIWENAEAAQKYPSIEVILLNLETPQNREKFFNQAMIGDPDPTIVAILERMIASIPV